MANKFYAAGEDRAARVNDLFAAIARRYDLINDLQSFWLHRFWKRRLVALAHPTAGERALDVCCGTGDVAFALARRGAEVVGLDFSEAMLAMARAKSDEQGPQSPTGVVTATRMGVCNPQFIRGDAQALPFPDAQFDLVTVSYGLRNLARWQTGLREMWRVAKPGGRLLVLDFGKPNNAVWRQLYFAYLRWCVPLFGKLLCGDAQTYAYILESLNHYPAQQGVAEEMRKINCRDVRLVHLLGGAMSINYATKA
jgi:demethylmenaquinone methyltransferase/2-methoxy-6-polyprenyl-1,4-benzoquinol methylase